MLFNIHKVFFLVRTHQCIVNKHSFGYMFRLINPSSGHYLLEEGTFNVCVHYGIP